MRRVAVLLFVLAIAACGDGGGGVGECSSCTAAEYDGLEPDRCAEVERGLICNQCQFCDPPRYRCADRNFATECSDDIY